MAKVHFLKLVFYRDDEKFLLVYDIFLEQIRFPQFNIKKEIKNESDLTKQMKKLEKDINNYGIICSDDYFQKSTLEIAEGFEQTFFFQVIRNPNKPISEDHIWLSAQEIIEKEDIVWWDQELISTYFTSNLKN